MLPCIRSGAGCLEIGGIDAFYVEINLKVLFAVTIMLNQKSPELEKAMKEVDISQQLKNEYQ